MNTPPGGTPRGPPPSRPTLRGLPPGSPQGITGPPRGPPPRGPPPRGPPMTTISRGPPPRGPPPGSPPFGSHTGLSPQSPTVGLPFPRGPPPRGPPPASPVLGLPQGTSEYGLGPSPRGPPPRGPPPSGPMGSPIAPGIGFSGPSGSSPRGPPPRGPPPGGQSGPPESPPHGAPPGIAGPGSPHGLSPREPPPGVGPTQGPPGMSLGGGFPGSPPGSPPRGPPPRGAPPPRPGVGFPGVMGAQGSPVGHPPDGSALMVSGVQGGLARGPPPRGPPPRGPPPRGPPPRGPPPRGPPPRGPPPTGPPPTGPPPTGPPPTGPPPSGPPSGPPRGTPPRSPPPRGPPPRGPPPAQGPPAPPSGSRLPLGPPRPAAAPKFGHLIIKCIKGVELKAGSGMFGKANPYCKVTIGTQEFSTRPHMACGKNPVWNEEHAFDISSEKEALFEIMDKGNVGQDKFMGELKVNIIDWVASGSFKGDLEVLDKSGMGVGTISVAVKFERPGAAGAGPGLSAGLMAVTGAKPAGAPPTRVVRDPSSNFTDQEIWEAFVSFDLDKNNFVGAAEIRHVLVNIGERVTDAEVDEMIRMADRDGDGQVSFAEFYQMISGRSAPTSGLGGIGGVAASAVRRGTGIGAVAVGAPPFAQNIVQQRNKKKQAMDRFTRDNNIKPESIKNIYKRFETLNKESSEMLDYTEFCEIMQVDPSPQSEGVFQLFEDDRSGQIDGREFMIALTNFVGAARDEILKFAFMVFDNDGNGVITKQELSRILKANHMAQTEAEVARRTETIMFQADKDGDGVISFDELVIVCKKFPNILFPSTTGK